jgi:hypothetical protein
LEKVSGWLDANDLVLNRDKTTTMFFGLKDLTEEEREQSAKFLGVWLDPALSWSDHSQKLCKRLASDIFALRRLCGVVSQHVIRLAYFGLFHSKMTYGLIVWGGAPASRDVFILQKRAVRVVAGVDFREHCRPLFINLRILTFYSVFILQNLLFMKNKSNLAYNVDKHNHDTRRKHDVQIPYVRLSKTMKKPSVIGTRLYNKLPLAVRNLEIKRFKAAITQFLLKNAFYSCDEFLKGSWTLTDFNI